MSEFKERRENLLSRMEENSLAIIFAGTSKITSEDEFYPFVVNRNFYYLTGIEQENSILVLIKGIGERKEYIFIDQYDQLKERWTGKRLSPEEARSLSNCSNIRTTTNFETLLDLSLNESVAQYGKIQKVYIDLSPEIKIKHETYTGDFAKTLKEKYTKIDVDNIYPLIMRLRMVKSYDEVEEIRKAINKTNLGINQLINNLKPGMYEYELADMFSYYGREKGRENLAFSTIVGAGINSTCLHYPTQDCQVKDGDIILFDLGYRHNLYCADISRTYPVNGVFSSLQRKIYEAVLNTNKAVIAYVREGLLISDLQEFAIQFLRKECLRLRLITPEDDIKKYYIHNVSHHLGLDTHDISDRNISLEAGNVITVEPGLYFPEHKIGVRIEDDVLVTHQGSEVLSCGIIKEISDIEKIFRTRR